MTLIPRSLIEMEAILRYEEWLRRHSEYLFEYDEVCMDEKITATTSPTYADNAAPCNIKDSFTYPWGSSGPKTGEFTEKYRKGQIWAGDSSKVCKQTNIVAVQPCTVWCSEIGSLTSLDDVTQVHPMTSENQFHCTRLYTTATTPPMTIFMFCDKLTSCKHTHTCRLSEQRKQMWHETKRHTTTRRLQWSFPQMSSAFRR